MFGMPSLRRERPRACQQPQEGQTATGSNAVRALARAHAPDDEAVAGLGAHQRALLHVHLRHAAAVSCGERCGKHGAGARASSSTWWKAFRNVSDSSISGATVSGRPAKPSTACNRRAHECQRARCGVHAAAAHAPPRPAAPPSPAWGRCASETLRRATPRLSAAPAAGAATDRARAPALNSTSRVSSCATSIFSG